MTRQDVFEYLCLEIDKYRKATGAAVLPAGFLDVIALQEDQDALRKLGLGDSHLAMVTFAMEQGNLSRNSKELLLAELEAKYEVNQEAGSVIKGAGLVAWDVASSLSSSTYWRSLESYWTKKSSLSDSVIRAIDKDTNEILGWCGNPAVSLDWGRRGLVMGHVQSGKTTNFSALVNKAFDVGYQHVVVLAGLTNSLRRQTQERLDETVLGKSSESDALNRQELGVAFYREKSDTQDILALTSESKDFNQLVNRQVRISEDSGMKILWVVKKNVKVLESLTKYLGEQLARNGHKLQNPMLVIDDEADNASVDTKYKKNKGNDPSAINAQIRHLLNCARRYSYVGYTATPFANIFIDPDLRADSDDELFPEDFIKSLEPADNYIGPHKLFNPDDALYKKCVIGLEDLERFEEYDGYSKYSDLIRDSHKPSLKVEELPVSLSDAILLFVAFCAFRVKSNTDDQHTSMLVNVSLYNAVQQQVYDLIEKLLRDLKSDVLIFGSSEEWRSSAHLSRMEVVYEQQEMARDLNWDFQDLLESLEPALQRVEQFLVNMSKDSKELKYPKNGKGTFALAIGGLALSRGLTLEGLVVSYIIRNVGAKDTLLQTARWFGYRDGFANACRVYMPNKLRRRFIETAITVEELRDDLKRMVTLEKTPKEFGLRVRHSGHGLSVTAPSKMGAGTKMTHSAEYSARHVQFAEVPLKKEKVVKNFDAIRSFVHSVGEWRIEREALVANKQPIKSVVQLLQNFQSDHLCFNLNSASEIGNYNLINCYILEREQELGAWDVVMPFSRRPTADKDRAVPATLSIKDLGMISQLTPFDLSSLDDLFLRQRLSGEEQEGNWLITKKLAVADQLARDVGFALTPEEREKLPQKNSEIFSFLERPVLMIHCLQVGYTPEKEEAKLLDQNPMYTLSVCLPGTKIPPIAREYVVNLTLARQLKAAQQIEEEVDEEEYDE